MFLMPISIERYSIEAPVIAPTMFMPNGSPDVRLPLEQRAEADAGAEDRRADQRGSQHPQRERKPQQRLDGKRELTARATISAAQAMAVGDVRLPLHQDIGREHRQQHAQANTTALTTQVEPKANANWTMAADSIRLNPTPRKKKSRWYRVDRSSLRRRMVTTAIIAAISPRTWRYGLR